MKGQPYIVLIIFICMAHFSWGQNKDFGFWTGLKVSKALNKDWKTFAEIQSRFSQNGSHWRSIFVQGGVNRDFSKWYNLGTVYRYTQFGDFDVHRLDIDNSFKYKVHKNTFELRLKYQNSWVTHKVKGQRFRVRFKYRLKLNKKWKPYFKAQYFYSRKYDYQGWNQQRYTVGVVARVAKKNYLDVFYTYQFEQNVSYPSQDYILGLKYKLNLK